MGIMTVLQMLKKLSRDIDWPSFLLCLLNHSVQKQLVGGRYPWRCWSWSGACMVLAGQERPAHGGAFSNSRQVNTGGGGSQSKYIEENGNQLSHDQEWELQSGKEKNWIN